MKKRPRDLPNCRRTHSRAIAHYTKAHRNINWKTEKHPSLICLMYCVTIYSLNTKYGYIVCVTLVPSESKKQFKDIKLKTFDCVLCNTYALPKRILCAFCVYYMYYCKIPCERILESRDDSPPFSTYMRRFTEKFWWATIDRQIDRWLDMYAFAFCFTRLQRDQHIEAHCEQFCEQLRMPNRFYSTLCIIIIIFGRYLHADAGIVLEHSCNIND